MVRLVRSAILIAFILSTNATFAACHAVTPSGSGAHTGADWNNAYAGLPSTLTRGDIYYLADGNYGSYTFNTPVSGTLTVEIRKAQTGDHCSDTGWNASAMGSSQATFSGSPDFFISSSYLTLNGNGQQTAIGCGGAPGSTVSGAPPNPKDCGITLSNTGDQGIDTPATISNINVQYVELRGSGSNTSNSQAEVWGGRGSINSSTWNHLYGHNAGCVYFQYAGDNRTVSNSYFWGTETQGGGPCHGQYLFEVGVANLVEFNNVYRDITGTAVWTFAGFSGSHGVAQAKLYDNVIFNSSPAASWAPFLSDGIISCIANNGTGETEQCNVVMVQNTAVNLNQASGINNDCTDGCGAGSSYTVENNIWYSGVGPSFTTAAPAAYTQTHNSCLNSGACPSGTSNVTDTSSPNPFTNWPAGVFTLVSDNADWNNRTSLGSPYDTDAAGKALTSDRGAYQYSGSQSQAPQPPTGLVVSVQ